MDYKSDKIVISSSDKDFILPKKYNNCIVYTIGSGKPIGNNYHILNDPIRLNQIAEEIRDKYCNWIYQSNHLFLEKNLIINDDLSLFFLTDFSCKRTEYFDTFNTICNIKEILEYIDIKLIKSVLLVSANKELKATVKQVFNSSVIHYTGQNKKAYPLIKGFITNHLFFFKALVVGIINAFSMKPIKKKYKNLYFTRYPLHFIDRTGVEDKYGQIDHSLNNYAVSILTDDYHQKVSLSSYLKYKNEVNSYNYSLVDSHLEVKDVISAYLKSFWYLRRWINISQGCFVFDGIDISNYCNSEIIFSYNKVIRLLMWENVFKRYLKNNPTDNFIYYLHEYPYGRLISYILSARGSIKSIGMQHGPSSKRKLVYYLAEGEASGPDKSFITQVPIPDKILAEDELSASIYAHSNYQNISIMPRVNRLSYLDEIIITKPRFILICPGLHDGSLMIDHLKSEIITNTNEIFLIKPHPRASRDYLSEYNYSNLNIVDEHISLLLGEAKEVIVTYSSVGMEARYLDVPVRLIDIPGKVSESPLSDF